MIPSERPDSADPLAGPWKDSGLPPEPVCDSLSDVLALAEPGLGPALIDKAGLGALHRAAACIPASLSSFWGLETRLGDPAPRADFLWEIRRLNADILASAGGSGPPAASLAAELRERSDFWREFGRFAEEWFESPEWDSLLGSVWLEADTAQAAEPEIGARLDRPNLFWGPNGRTAGSDRELLGRLAGLGRRFYALEPDRARIAAAARALPRETLAFQMGVMGARAAPVVRLCVKNPDMEAHVRWLAEIGWPGDLETMRGALARLASMSGELALNVDILPDRVGEKLGVEAYAAERTLSMDAWRPLHEELRAQGLARADKLAALENFPFAHRYRQFGAWRRNPPLGFPAVVGNLHHVKLVFVGRAAVEAKAYLGVFRPVMDYSGARGSEITGESGGWTP